jgi:hypothetical protein
MEHGGTSPARIARTSRPPAHLPPTHKIKKITPIIRPKTHLSAPLLRAQGPKGAPLPGPVGGTRCARITRHSLPSPTTPPRRPPTRLSATSAQPPKCPKKSQNVPSCALAPAQIKPTDAQPPSFPRPSLTPARWPIPNLSSGHKSNALSPPPTISSVSNFRTNPARCAKSPQTASLANAGAKRSQNSSSGSLASSLLGVSTPRAAPSAQAPAPVSAPSARTAQSAAAESSR